MVNNSKSNLLIRSSTFGYVVENFLQLPVEKPNSPNFGKVLPYITRNGRYAIFPDIDSVPPKWRPYAKEATDQQVANGWPMPRVVKLLRTEDVSTGKVENKIVKDSE